jgi:membrane associated rhomboid family serine protease
MIPIRDNIPSKSFPVVNWILILANLFVFLLESSLNPEASDFLVYEFGLVPARFSHPEWADLNGFSTNSYWPFLTNMFLHGGWAHFLGNMWTLYIFGDNVEDRMGRFNYLFFYLLCGVAASLTHYFMNMDSVVPAIGASGAISGVMGAYMFLFPRGKIVFFLPLFFLPYFIELSAFVYLAFWFLTQLFSGTWNSSFPAQSGGIAFWAHIGGFAAGALLYSVFIKKKKKYYDEY